MFPFHVNLPEGPVGVGLWLVTILMIVVNLLIFVFWVLVSLRAVRAHERLPEVLARRPGVTDRARQAFGNSP